MYLFLYGAGRNDFDAGNIHYEGLWKGRALKTFLGPEMATSEASAIWAPKNRDFRTHPFNGLTNGVARIKIIEYVQAPYKNR
jgi:hypothetical protein